MKKQGFLYGSAVLMISAVLVKITGALFKIPLTNLLGGTGMGYFSAAYSIFMPVYAVSATGLPASVARSVADSLAKGREDEAETVRKISLKVFAAVGLAACLVIMIGAYPFCKYITKDIYALPAVIAIAPSALAGCLISVYRGCYEGRRDMYPTAVSQVIEGAAKLVLGLSLCGGCIYLAKSYPEVFLRIIGCEGKNISVNEAVVPYSAAAAVLGITLSSFAGLIYMKLKDRRRSVCKHTGGKSADNRRILADLLRTALPGAVGALVINLTSTIDLVTVMYSLRRLIEKTPWIFSDLLGKGIAYKAIPNFIYGSFTGIAVTIFNLIPSFTNMFGKSILPAAAAAKAEGSGKRLTECAGSALFMSALVSVPAGIGLSVMAEPVLRLLFRGRELEIAVCIAPMKVLGAAVPFLCISSAAFALLQAVDRADIPVKLMSIGAAVKLTGNLLLTSDPRLGVTGAALSTLICYVLMCIMSIGALSKCVKLDISALSGVLVRIIVGSMLCGAGAFFMHNAIYVRVGESISAVISCAFGGVIYIISTYFLGVITKSTVKTLIS